ncbi:MBG domain-containing protein [Flammeovirga kamogawensis]|uniref:T9SS type A sorting domain-containing protein n=1 Tax=Flammeovirga kamogawensis TaxID=373891 RepID=A0ABX8H219_9BACT|nr:MBG domain-containing protein [Flammeovirga kamogawensis]MBB6462585.1 hypothetical protein [Flammeovirga kamogawensis]QWG09668.1 T9SS type A sorting domain-containing protein [Flammeovirga kamogawensis]TRX65182.1 T9SS type A sorting domain-containing protein [Flammeovirga kamogawensis]
MKKNLLFVMITNWLLLVASVSFGQTTYFVNSTTGVDTSDGSEASPWKSINTHISSLVEGDIMYIEGTFNEKIIVNRHISIIGKSVDSALIDGTGIEVGAGSGVTINATVTLSNLTIQNFNVTTPGAGIKVNANQTLTMRNCNVLDNTTTNNSGGGIWSGATATIENCYISGNQSGSAGSAIFTNQGALKLYNNVIVGNHNSKITGSVNGAINISVATEKVASVVEVINNTVVNNTAGFSGNRGIYVSINGTGVLTDLTIANNIFNNPINFVEGQITWGNDFQITGDIYENDTYVIKNNLINVDFGTNPLIDADNNGLIDNNSVVADMLFDESVKTAANGLKYIALLDGSPAINAADETYAIGVDMFGFERVGTADIGAVEFGTTAPKETLIINITSELSSFFTGSDQSVTYQLLDENGVVVEGVTSTLTITQNDIEVTPNAVGEYKIQIDVVDDNYQGTLTETLTIVEELTPTESVYYVDAVNGSDAADGSEASPWKTLTYAASILNSYTGKTLMVNGEFNEAGFDIFDGTEYTIDGTNAATSSINADGLAERHFDIFGGLTLKNITLKNASITEGGGALRVGEGADLTLENVNLVNNSTTKNGGAITSSGNIKISQSYIANNTASVKGSAIAVNGGVVDIQNTTIYQNNTLDGNSVAGGALLIGSTKDYGIDFTFVNNTVVENTGIVGGGSNGIIFEQSAGKVVLTDFSNNIIINMPSGNGQTWVTGDVMTWVTGLFTVDGIVVSNNITNKVQGTFPSDNGNLTSVTLSNLAFGSLTQNGDNVSYLPILTGSSAIDAGNDTSAPEKDIAGNFRNQTADVGAFEFEGLSAPLATVSLTKATAEYTGSAIDVEFEITNKAGEVLSGLTTTITYNSSEVVPTDAGVYDVVISIDQGQEFGGALTTQFEITKATTTVTLDTETLTATYSGSANDVTASSNEGEQIFIFSYKEDGEEASSTAPINVGEYLVTATLNDKNYTGETQGTLTISPASITYSSTTTDLVYNTSAQEPTVIPSVGNFTGFSTSVTEGEAINVDSYTLVVTTTDPNYTGSSSIPFSITKATATIQITDLLQTYTGNQLAVTTITSPEGLNVDVTYDNEVTAPTEIASYEVVATINDVNYEGTQTETFQIVDKLAAIIEITSSSKVYNADGQEVEYVIKDEQGTVLDIPATVTYDDGVTPMNVKEYAVTIVVNTDEYAGSLTSTFEITKASVTFTPSTTSFVYNGEKQIPTITTSVEGLEAEVSLLTGDATTAGEYSLNVSSSSENYEGNDVISFEITKAEVIITLSSLEVDFDDSPKEVVATTDTDVESIAITYNGNDTPPTEAGEYKVVATIVDPNYMGTTEGTLVINELTPADPTAIQDEQALQVSVYPNPNQGTFTVKLIDSSVAQLSIVTVSGKEVHSSEVTNQSTITLPSNVSGIVIVKLVDENKVYTAKLYVR